MEKIVIETKKEREIVDVTDKIQNLVSKSDKGEGFCHLFLTHSTAGLTTSVLDSEIELFDAFEAPVPKDESPRLKYEHTHMSIRMPAHFMGSFLGPSLSIPVEKGKLILGDFQRIVLVELNGPKKRTIVFDY